ncbi:protein ALP1-like [Tachysurus fulvidraco]|uniref:protein ALP1-like n=1 Tax=Tachysurus fulvidraco TaxID=1234273 RepID=UPI000F4D9FD9|nr:protein ALP1-like [Tachysurus fulvidraco]
MDISTKTCLLLALSEHSKLMNRYIIHTSEELEEQKKRTRIATAAILRSPHTVTPKTGTKWEVMPNVDNDAFYHPYKVTKRQFDFLLMVLQQQGLKRQKARGLPTVPVRMKVLMFLWYMGNQNGFRDISDKFDVSESTAHKSVLEVLTIFSNLGASFISWPNAGRKKTSSAAFQKLCGLSGIIGVIDGCHIKINRPNIRGGDYMNRQSYYSVLLQGIVDEKGRFIDIFVGPPGRVDDARMLRASHFYADWQEKMGEYSLLGDSAYTDHADPFIITPKADNDALSEDDQLQNSCINSGRVVIDQAFAKMKCKWRRVRDLQNTRLENVVMIIMAACFLHNMCIGDNEACEEHPQGCPRKADDNV